MNFVPKLLQALGFIPAIVSGLENLFGKQAGGDKKNAAISFVEAAVSLSEAVTAKDIVDDASFRAGLEEIINGTVKCLNASIWAK